MNSSDDTGNPAVSPLPWYGLHIRSNHEKVAATVLAGKGYQQYLPVYLSRRQWSDRVVQTEKPLLPGYVFCRFNPRNCLPIMTTPGVISVVGYGSTPAPITDAEIAAVQAIVDSGLATEPHPFLRTGQRVRIKRGSLQGLEGILVKKKANWRLVVSVDMLHRSVSVEIDPAWVDSE
jgi:transcription antitermination factor NusG